ncbi:MAG: hypothetical protein INR69_14420 [Mucilaginibacter polytrichastri]|nr:hypothetical protein [Mucilaginibacter polytrichastri]
MKKLTYSLSLICFFLSLSACNKEENVNPRGTPPKTDLPKNPPVICDSASDVNYVLSNNTGVTGFTIMFAGEENYTFSFPANGRKTVQIKPGFYYIMIPPAGNYSDHTFSVGTELAVRGKLARYERVKVSSCTINQVAEIN